MANDPAKGDRHNKSILDFVSEDARQLSQTFWAPPTGGSSTNTSPACASSNNESTAHVRQSMWEWQSIPGHSASQPTIKSTCGSLGDLLVLAFQCDLTRIVTFVFANDGSNRSYRTVGVSDGHHDLSHHGGDAAKQEKIQKINRFHTAQLAYILESSRAIREGDGTLLDHCMIIYGSGISDGNVHSHDDLPILLAGKGNGTIKTGRHVRYTKETPLTNLFVSLLERMGAGVDAFGDSTGQLTSLEG